ncbi:polysaccharide deacetylase family protein [Dongia soli]|uniref:Polysaccharide deacetylase family protein n=1 Tax=Dongia soli TaxID=600628 RepID=A0ABU5E7Y8_9PROT|nr:polysaccharide deacetylase family protein [Dongia soli]MDY0882022.1 polysaccharide deacetylase family protein [Dongia soli]
MTGWDALAEELAQWSEAGRVATLWWRDDDAVAATPALARLLEAARVPLALAVIPGLLEQSLAAALRHRPDIAVLQHGFKHRNHEPAGMKNAELGGSRSPAELAADLASGWRSLRDAFGNRALPVLTPPWNRIAPAHLAALPDWGYCGISTYLARRTAYPVAELLQVNTHIDVIDWHGGKVFVGEVAALRLLTGHLRARRVGEADPDEPTGLLTHHLVHDAATWAFLDQLQDWLSRQAMIRWLSTGEVFGGCDRG